MKPTHPAPKKPFHPRQKKTHGFPKVDESPTRQLTELREAIQNRCLLKDKNDCFRELRTLWAEERAGKLREASLLVLKERVQSSVAHADARVAQRPEIAYPDLPITEIRGNIQETLQKHPVVVIAGETGSGKTTQLPKLCLEMGRGVRGLIGHTQPRRIAARSVAMRVAEELGSPLGQVVGYQVRFTDRVSPESYIKLMTDGILLAEIPSDRYLDRYDTLIIDEAHERSLNIDFLLGYLKKLLPKRPDLKVIITSATIDTERFAQHFAAPIITIPGRTYPVETRYRPLVGEDEDSRDQSMMEGILTAVDELSHEKPGDILIFLSGEREIREAAESLRKHHPPQTEILPLYARLSAAEQQRIFEPHANRRIVLSTNVAETSLTVPGIRYVIDTGYARVSRYSHRVKVQRLPIEPVSQAAANQRAGRCGRVAPGICIRLYSEEDFHKRPFFTDPEILRTHLAAVILRMKLMGLDEIASFPFLDPPDRQYINDGLRLLREIRALQDKGSLTALGRELARLPVDPRLGRMVLEAKQRGTLSEVLIIVSVLSIQDPRERPVEHQAAADQAHNKFRHKESDFLTLVALWKFYHEQARHLSQRKQRQFCKDHFLSYVRMREWHDLHAQLLIQVKEMGMHPNELEADYRSLHLSLLSGLLDHIGLKRPESSDYQGARGIKFHLFPGSGLFKHPPKWLVAAELVETSRLYARVAAKVEPEWIEEIGQHLLKRSQYDPHWEQKPGIVAALEQVTLHGLILSSKRKVYYGTIDPVVSRDIFIRQALVEGEYRPMSAFLQHNLALYAEIEDLEERTRRRDIIVDIEDIYRFYDARLPETMSSRAEFEPWRRQVEKPDSHYLFFKREDLIRSETPINEADFPKQLIFPSVTLPLAYHFAPGESDDGATLVIPLPALSQVPVYLTEWLVPGLLLEKIEQLIKSLPKSIRRHFVPVPNFARSVYERIRREDLPITEAIGRTLTEITGIEIPKENWRMDPLAPHLSMNFRVLDGSGAILEEGRDLVKLQRQWSELAQTSLRSLSGTRYQRKNITRWDFGDLPEVVTQTVLDVTLQVWPGLEDHGESVAMMLFDHPQRAKIATLAGVKRLFELTAGHTLRHLKRNFPHINTLCLHYLSVGSCDDLKQDLLDRLVTETFLPQGDFPRTMKAFQQQYQQGEKQLITVSKVICQRLYETLELYAPLYRAIDHLPKGLTDHAKPLKEHLISLIYPGFLREVPNPWLSHYPRYLKALDMRVKRLLVDPRKDAIPQVTLEPFLRDYLALIDYDKKLGVVRPALIRYRWLLEEFRVSLFAPSLKTSEPVSVKRLESEWKKVVG